MFHQFKVLIVLVVWLMTTGAHLDVLQGIAWTRMILLNAAEMPIGEAVARTFQPEAKCTLCHTVDDARQEQRKDPALGGLASGKAPLIVQFPDAIVFTRPEASAWTCEEVSAADHHRSAPPLPPPRQRIV